MGLFWAILMPSLIVLAGVVVRFGYAFASHSPLKAADLMSVAVRSLPWAFTVSAVRFATSSLGSNEDLVTKIYFPKEIIPISAVTACAFDVGIASLVLAVVLGIAGVPATVNLLWVPVLLIMLLVLVTGAALIASAAGLFFRDVKFLVEIVLTFGVFFTPVFFKTSMFGRFAPYFMLNPLAPIIEGLDAVVIAGHPPDFAWLAYSGTVAVLALLGGYLFFKRLEPMFAEYI
jgi:ABC-type polysaccharide/polyol phosphate export permease